MTFGLIALTASDGHYIWANTTHITHIEEKGSRAVVWLSTGEKVDCEERAEALVNEMRLVAEGYYANDDTAEGAED